MAPTALPPRPPLAPPAAASTLAQLLGQLALPAAAVASLHLRFERVRRFVAGQGRRARGSGARTAVVASAARPGRDRVGVFVSWQVGCVRRGEVQHLLVLEAAQARTLQADCRRVGLRFVNNL